MVFVDELLSFLQSPDFEFCSFRKKLKTRRAGAKQASKQSYRDLMTAQFTQDYIDT